ncbi:unnamed protein product [Lactuca virosa]|uniref:PGG domain-containing protein n=1 Tax=Lactuca virosa TaxID=75947 RepID=A0AAU9NTA2_9ASTR|nr:unnamed protein product [Lactuca virosa]
MLDYFKYNNLNESPSIVRNTLLVVVILITTATYQPALSPPGDAWQDDSIPSAGNNTLSSTTNITASIKRHTAGTAIMGTENPIAYSIFLFANSMGFYMSVHMIYILTDAFPLQLELQISLVALGSTVFASSRRFTTSMYRTTATMHGSAEGSRRLLWGEDGGYRLEG